MNPALPMGKAHPAEKVCLVAAICYREEGDLRSLLPALQKLYGPIAEESQHFSFVHTRYYEKEMGIHLAKFYIAFHQFIEPMEIVSIKIQTNDMEDTFSDDGRRRINLDPGYLEIPKLVLATTKNFGHRIYLGQGIYGDVQLFWRQGGFQVNPWTYPDYAEKTTKEFFTKIRQKMLLKKDMMANSII
jgi:hypothetical protein